MNRYKFYIITMLIGVLCAGYFIYNAQAKNDENSVLVSAHSAQVEKDLQHLFPHPDKTLYEMGLYLDINKRILYGSTILTTSNTSGQILEELWFTAYPNAFRKVEQSPAPLDAYYAGFDDGWLEFTEIKVNGKPVDYILDGMSIQVILEEDILPDQNVVVKMQWMEKIPKVAYRYGTKNNIFMLGNFYPILNVFSDNWHNSYNSAFGDPFCFHAANYFVRLNTPEAYSVASTGTNLQRVAEDNGRQTHIIKAFNVRDFSLAILYNYEEVKQRINNTMVKVYAPVNNMDMSKEVLNQTTDILNYYSCKLGSYPYEEFKVVFVPMQGFHGMEYAGLIFLRDEFLSSNHEHNRGEFILAHEIAHQWWYGMVGNDQLKEPWLDEGLANWSAYKYLQEIKGKNVSSSETLTEGVNLAKELRDIYSKPEYYKTAYSGGEAFWFGLEKELGTEKVFKVLRRYLADFKYNIATTQDLFRIIKIEAHKDMDEYFNRWFKP